MPLPYKPIPTETPTSQDWQNASFRIPLIKISIYSIAIGLTGFNSLLVNAQNVISQNTEQNRGCEEILEEWELVEPSISSSYDPSTPAGVYTPSEVTACYLTPSKRRPRQEVQENTTESEQKLDPAKLDCETRVTSSLIPKFQLQA